MALLFVLPKFAARIWNFFILNANDDQWRFPPSQWLDFLPFCPQLRQLFVDYHREYPTQIWQRRFADLLPNGLEILERTVFRVDELIAELIEICKSRLRRQNVVNFASFGLRY